MRLEDLNDSGDGRLASPSAERNREPIAEVLSQVLPQSGLVLEVGLDLRAIAHMERGKAYCEGV